jgi:hypothetical protein
LVKLHPEYQFLKNILPVLIEIAEEIAKDVVIPNVCPDFHTMLQFLCLLERLTLGSDSSLLELLPSHKRTALVKRAISIPENEKCSRFAAVSLLMRAGACLEKAEFQQLKNIRQKIDPEELIDQINFYRGANNNLFSAFKINTLASAIAVEPAASQLQKLFSLAKKTRSPLCMSILLQGVSYAMKFLSKEERHQLFTLTMQIGKIEKEKQPHTKMNEQTIRLFKIVVSNAKYLHPTEVDALTTFIMNCKGRPNYTELMCLLVEAARWNQQLSSALIAALGKRKETSTLYGRMLRIEQLLPEQRHQLVEDVLALNHDENRAHMLGLLGGRMEHLKSEDRGVILNHILQLHSESGRSEALCGVATSIVCLGEQNSLRLLEAIKALILPLHRAMVLSLVEEAVIKKWERLLQDKLMIR